MNADPRDPNTPAHEPEEVASDEEQQRAELVKQIQRLATSDDADLLLQVLEVHLVGAITERTFRPLDSAAKLLVGNLVWGTLLGLVHGVPRNRRADAIDSLKLPSEGRQYLTRIIALYAARLGTAINLSGMWESDDWDATSSDVMRDVESGEYLISFLIVKRNGEQMVIRADPASFVRFAIHVLQALRLIDDPDAFPDDDLRPLYGEVDAIKTLQQEDSEGRAAAPPTETSPADRDEP